MNSLDWLDSHCHVTADEFAEDRKEVMNRATGRRCGNDDRHRLRLRRPDHNAKAVALAAEDDRVFATVGLHPHEAEQMTTTARLKKLRGWLEAPRVVAVGECGLDYFYEKSPRAAQREAFAWHVEVARELGLPVSIHVRDREADAYEELLDIWGRPVATAKSKGVLHCYTHDLPFARRAMACENLCISFSGILTFKNDRGLRRVAAELPLERLLIETDAPLLGARGPPRSPQRTGSCRRGRTNPCRDSGKAHRRDRDTNGGYCACAVPPGRPPSFSLGANMSLESECVLELAVGLARERRAPSSGSVIRRICRSGPRARRSIS